MDKFIFKAFCVVFFLSITGCGKADRFIAGVIGHGAEICQDGVVYLQFTSGVSVAYQKDGKVRTCD